MRDEGQLREGILALGRRVAETGLVVGAGGNISAHEDGSEEIIITPSGHNLAQLEAKELVVMTVEGERVRGDLTQSSESNMHLAAYRARPDASVVVHLHPTTSSLLHALGHPIRFLTIDHAYYLRRLAQVPYIASGTVELAEAAARKLSESNVILLRYHGSLIVADSFDLAFSRAANLEAAANATYRALLLGDADTVCPPEYLERVERIEQETGSYAYGQRR
jgi:L-fuculose-phosphate aldolase